MNTLRKLSLGKKPGNYGEARLLELFNSKVAVGFIDTPKVGSDTDVSEFFSERTIKPEEYELDFEEAVRKNTKLAKEKASLHKSREAYMLSQLGPKILQIVREKPDLRKKEEIRVLLTLGSYHTEIYHTLKKQEGDTVSRTFRSQPIYDHFSELQRKFQFNAPTEDMELQEKAFASHLLDRPLTIMRAFDEGPAKDAENQMIDSHEMLRVRRALVDSLTEPEIKELYSKWQEIQRIKPRKMSPLIKYLREKMKEKGIELPAPKQHVD